jgi:DNA-binding NarL/FixJ family response regulator
MRRGLRAEADERTADVRRHGANSLLRRPDATPDAMVRAIVSVASGVGEVPADLVARLLTQLGRLQRQVLIPRGFTFSGLTERETDVFPHGG